MTEPQAGRELDALIEERVFGATWHSVPNGAPTIAKAWLQRDIGGLIIAERMTDLRVIYFAGQAYSTDIAAAWEVLDYLWARGYCGRTGRGTYRIQVNRRDGVDIASRIGFGIWARPGDDMADAWVCEIATDPEGDFSTHSVGVAATAPHAICLAALKAVGGTPQETETQK